MPVNPTIITGSEFSGFKNYSISPQFSATITGQTLTVGTKVSATATTALNNTNSITQVQVNYAGLEAFWRVVPGRLAVDYPNWTSASYQLETQISFSGGTLSVQTYAINQTGGSVVIPTITINCKAFLFLAPF